MAMVHVLGTVHVVVGLAVGLAVGALVVPLLEVPLLPRAWMTSAAVSRRMSRCMGAGAFPKHYYGAASRRRVRNTPVGQDNIPSASADNYLG